ncbi:MAG: GNAT family N-acetyltransferase [Acidimicrobiia bacterium]
MGNGLELREVTDENREQVLSLQIRPDQQRFTGGTFAEALADADEFPEAKPWPRAVYLDDEPVGFVMLSWDVEPDPPTIIGPWFLWKLLIDEDHQGRGLGGQIVDLIAARIRREGATELLTSYVDEEGGPGSFYAKLGFVPTGERDDNDEIIVALPL